MTSHGHLEVLGHARQFHLKSHFEDEEIHKFAERPHLRVASSYICKLICQESQVSRKQRDEGMFFSWMKTRTRIVRMMIILGG